MLQLDGSMLGNVQLFCHTAELASFTRAAARAGITQAAVSRAVSRLEAHLGVRLLVRSTRNVRLTEQGRLYYEQCRQAFEQLADAERELLSGDGKVPSGTVRCSLPTSYGHFRVLPVLAEFCERFPQVQLDVQLSNRDVDLIGEGYDLAIRGRTPPDSALVARKLEDAELVVVAAPSYLRRHGAPACPDDLQRHRCIQFERPRTGQPVPWLLRVEGRELACQPPAALRISDDILGVSAAAGHGLGIAQTYRFIVADELAAGRLVELLPDCGGASRPFSILYPGQRHMPRRVRVLVDFLLERLRRD